MPDNVSLNFPHAEYAERLAKTRAAMAEAEIGLLILTDPSNMAWLTGYDGWSFYVHQCVLVPGAGDPIWWGRKMDAVGAEKTVWMDKADILFYEDHYVQSVERHPMEQLSGIILDKGWHGAAIGVEMDNYYFSAKAYEVLRNHLLNATFKDATALVNWQRAVKSERELDYMRIAARIVEGMHQRIADVAEPGLRKCDLAAEIYDVAVRGTPNAGGDYPAIVPLMPSGPEATAAHLTWDDKPLKKGEGTFFEIAGVHQRYHCPLCRTVYLGQPPQKMLDAQKAVLEGMEAGLEKARAGNVCEDIAVAFFDVLEGHGIQKDSRTGYPVGLSYPPDWGERTMSLRRGDKTVLQENMTFHFMTALWMDDWGLELTETIRITNGAPELLAHVPRKMLVKP